MITEETLIKLGFEKEESDDMDEKFHYYVYDTVYGINLITCSNDSVKDKTWKVFVGHTNDYFKNLKDLEDFINILNSFETKSYEKESNK